jgi:Homeodomain-like domain
MTSTSHRAVRGRLRLAVAGAVMLTTLTTGTAAATAGTARSGASPKAPAGPRSDTPVFVLDKGRFTAFDVPGPAPQNITRDWSLVRAEAVLELKRGRTWAQVAQLLGVSEPTAWSIAHPDGGGSQASPRHRQGGAQA